ncbi:hypothetical protein GZ77_26165 [Endozoicomonas montiporae]|uniref:Uncharacterized protein n=1 Tax=Endozoicomonas montiporae TaxID=1027273 RepID=A0A081MYM4_9GAMM|nr:hypothetical protein [Endozoicomonas montiporae]KEQ11251.1 hypothetical protein GZ77_26510 [Endozoicomonas montiporae]KEQ11297.1 hypothetical protein GZ77_26165 [Endozoicomonas montiporae]
MLGYVSVKEAKKYGCTHHGSYYGIPVWLDILDQGSLVMMAKWSPMDYAIDCVSVLEGIIRPLRFPDEPNCFQVKVLREI